jgi:hypothetical protein
MEYSDAHLPLKQSARRCCAFGATAAAFVLGLFGLSAPTFADSPPVSLEAAKQWQFTPSTLKDELVAIIDNTWVTFQISEYVMR